MIFFKLKTAYNWRISDRSSDVCSSDHQIGPQFLVDVGQTHLTELDGIQYLQILQGDDPVHTFQFVQTPHGISVGLLTIVRKFSKHGDNYPQPFISLGNEAGDTALRRFSLLFPIGDSGRSTDRLPAQKSLQIL